MPSRIFARDELETIGVPDSWSASGPAAEHLHEEQVDTRRWVSWHELVFRAPDDGRVWRVAYRRGLTELQDGTDPWDWDDTVTAEEVEQHQVTRLEWREVPD